MLTGERLGAAIGRAIELKGVSKRDVADHFGVRPPSVQDWIKRGTIRKDKLEPLFRYFADVVGPEHWGLEAEALSYPRTGQVDSSMSVREPTYSYSRSRPEWPFPELSERMIADLPLAKRRILTVVLKDAAAEMGVDITFRKQRAA